MRPSKNCREFLDGLSDYIDGEAAAELCEAIRGHLAACEKCRVVVDTLRMTVRLYREAPQPDLSSGVRETLYKALDVSDYLRGAR